jgi:hypothetical protein
MLRRETCESLKRMGSWGGKKMGNSLGVVKKVGVDKQLENSRRNTPRFCRERRWTQQNERRVERKYLGQGKLK